jgi:hypothetical protein
MSGLEHAVDTERRSAIRHSVVYRLDVLAPGGCAGCLLDLSITGMRVRFRDPLDLAAVQKLTVEFPRWLELGAGLELSGRFVWVRSTSEHVTEAGFAFDGLSRKEENVLRLLIQRLTEALSEDRASAAA